MKKALPILALSLIAPLAAAQAPATGQQRPSMAEMFIKQLDTNKDGKVSMEEFLAPHKAQFKHMDKNGDGVITRDEADAFAAEMKQRMEQMRKQRGNQQGAPTR